MGINAISNSWQKQGIQDAAALQKTLPAGKKDNKDTANDNNNLSPVPRYDEYIKGDSAQQFNGENNVENAAPDTQQNSSGSPDENVKDSNPPSASKAKESSCTVNTDAVDREIEQLKKLQQSLEQQLAKAKSGNEENGQKLNELESQLENISRELQQKDNDAYRKAHASFTYSANESQTSETE